MRTTAAAGSLFDGRTIPAGMEGVVLEARPDGTCLEHSSRFAFNCDIATPTRRRNNAVYAVDLFTDVLMQADSVTYRVCDLQEFQQACTCGNANLSNAGQLCVDL